MGNDTELKSAIARYDREAVNSLLKKGALEDCSEEEREDVLRGIVGLRNMAAIDILSKRKADVFKPEMFEIGSNLNNREFLSEVLAKYWNRFDLSQETVSDWLFEAACATGCKKVAKGLLQQKKGIGKLYAIAGNGEKFYDLLSAVKREDVPDDAAVTLIVETAKSKEAEPCLKYLKNHGYSLVTKNSEGKSAYHILEAATKSKPKNKQEANEIRTAQIALRALKNAEAEETKPLNIKKILAIALPAAVIIILLCIALYASGKKEDEDAVDAGTETAAGTETVEAGTETAVGTETGEAGEGTADSAETGEAGEGTADGAETGEAGEGTAAGAETGEASDGTQGYSTDSSLTVADGDTVNIDYVGSIDGVEFSGGSTNGAGTDLVIGSGSYIDDFEEQLIGHAVGETVDVNVTFPENYGNEDLNGKDALFQVTINGIYE